MNIGMLWFDNDIKRDFNAKITRAVNYYEEKYGSSPNLCFVNPCMVANGNGVAEKEQFKSGSITIRTSPTILPNHFWIGIQKSH